MPEIQTRWQGSFFLLSVYVKCIVSVGDHKDESEAVSRNLKDFTQHLTDESRNYWWNDDFVELVRHCPLTLNYVND
jgi:hypothetical protein